MKALYYNEQKGYQAIKVGDLPVPEIKDTEVLVRVKAFSLNHLDVWVMSGSYPLTIPLPHIFGSDASGIVERTGTAVSHVKAGDEVVVHPGLSCGHCASCMGGRDNECNEFSVLGVVTPGVSAEYVKVPAGNLFPKPARLSFEEAAGIGITYTTAWNSLVLRAGIRQGEIVLVQAAGSGAGTAMIQVAKLFNATVITTVGDDWKVAKAKELGADLVINHRREDFLDAVKQFTGGKLVDITVDHVGGDAFARSVAAVRRGGRIVAIGATAGDAATISLRQVFGKNLTVHGVYVGPKAAVPQYLPLFPHKLRTIVDSVSSFEDAPKAYEKLLSRQIFGKIIVAV
jgi:NADPH:quinone reductase-like Zn-dependent oxidoreductase